MQRLLLTVVRAAFLGTLALSRYEALAQVSLTSADHPLYTNRAYGFKVVLPPGLTYTPTVPPNPDHGLGIRLKDQVRLWVDASYTESSSTEDEAKKLSEGCQIEERRPVKLGSRSGLAVRFSCAADPYSRAYEDLLALTVYMEGDRSRVDYQVGMRTYTRTTTLRERGIFDKLVAGFSFLE